MSDSSSLGAEGMTDPSAILELTTAYWASMVLLAANRLRVFTHLATDADLHGKQGSKHQAPVPTLILGKDRFNRRPGALPPFLTEFLPQSLDLLDVDL